MYLLDTNVVSELRKVMSGTANHQVVQWVERVPIESLYISAISILEIETGVLRMERRDARQGAILRAWLDHTVLTTFASRILPVDLSVAQRCSQLHVPDPQSTTDALIAATALVHGMTVVTGNMVDFAATGVSLLNPWEPV